MTYRKRGINKITTSLCMSVIVSYYLGSWTLWFLNFYTSYNKEIIPTIEYLDKIFELMDTVSVNEIFMGVLHLFQLMPQQTRKIVYRNLMKRRIYTVIYGYNMNHSQH